MSLSLLLKLVATASTFGVSMLLARTLGPAGYGIYTFYLVIIMLLAAPLQNGLSHLVVRDAARYFSAADLASLKSLFAWALRSSVVVGLACVAIVMVCLLLLPGEVHDQMPGRVDVFFYGLALVVTIPLTGVIGSTLRGIGAANLGQVPDRNLRPAILLVTLGIAWFFYKGGLTPTIAMLLHAGASLASLIIASLFLRHTWASVISGQNAAPHDQSLLHLSEQSKARGAFTFAMVALLQLLNGSIGVLVLGSLGTEEQVGVYRVTFQLAALTSFGVAAINPSIHAKFATLIARGDTLELQKVVSLGARLSFLVAIIPALSFLLFPREIVGFLYGPEYFSDRWVVALLVLGQLANVAFGAVAALMNMAGKQVLTFRAMLAASMLNSIVTLILVPFTGVVGAALGSAAGLLFWNALLWFQVRKTLGVNSAVWCRH